MSKCNGCGQRMMDAEDWRDHLPCPGSVESQLRAMTADRDRLAAEVAGLRERLAKLNNVALDYVAWCDIADGEPCNCGEDCSACRFRPILDPAELTARIAFHNRPAGTVEQ